MESAISAFCQSLSSLCHHADTSSRSLTDSIQRRPIPLDSAASAFLQCIDRRISSASADLGLLESMAFGTVSFEELMGHCNEVLKLNAKYISDIEDRMRTFGYIPELELEDDVNEDSDMDSKFASPINNLDKLSNSCASVSVARSNRKILDIQDSLFEESISLHNLGLSNASLATLALEDDGNLDTLNKSSGQTLSFNNCYKFKEAMTSQLPKDASNDSATVFLKDDFSTAKSDTEGIIIIKASKDDYDGLPSYMKNLASWEELQGAVVKMNSYLCGKGRAKERHAFNQDDLETMDLGRKGRSCLLLLLRMNQLFVENIDGSIFYGVRSD